MKFRFYNVYLIYFLLLFAKCSIVQNKVSTNQTKNEIVNIEVDKLGDYYTIDSKGSIAKYKNKKKKYVFSNYNLGDLSTVDVTNPHKILLFYRDQQTIVLLDNSLVEINRISLSSDSFISAIGMANDGNIWVFDAYLAKLKKIDGIGKDIEESFPVSKINPEDIIDSKIIDRDNFVIIADKNKGVLLFDNMGFFERTIPVENVLKPTIVKNKLYFFDQKENCYISRGLGAFSADEKLCFNKYNIQPLLVLYENSMFYMLLRDKVEIYSKDFFK